MTTPLDPGYAGVAELPPYRSLLVVDRKDYSGNAGRYQTELTRLIPQIMKSAFKRAGLAEIWACKTIYNTTGDGYAIGLPAEFLAFLLNPYLGLLQAELEERNNRRPVSWNGPIRFRVSINVGPIADSGTNLLGDGSGNDRVVLHRLLDSAPVRRLLDGSDPEVTHVAAIVSPRVYEDAVLAKYADEPASLYVATGIEVKTFEGQAYLRVPKPSGDLLVRGFLRSEAKPPAPTGPDASASAPASDRTGVQINDHTGTRHGGIGNIGTVGTLISGATGAIHTGSGSQYNLPDGPQPMTTTHSQDPAPTGSSIRPMRPGLLMNP